MNPERDVIVFLESSGEKAAAINRGLLTEGRRIAVSLNGSLSAMTVGTGAEDATVLGESGVSTLYHVAGAGLSRYSGEAFAWAAASALADIPFRLILFAHTDRGSDIAPRLGFHLRTGAVTRCVDIRVRQEGILYVRPVYGGQLEQEIAYSDSAHEIASIEPAVLAACKTADGADHPLPRIIRILVDVPPDLPRTEMVEIVPPDYETVDILYARRIIGVGSGSADPDLLGLVGELSRLLEGSLGTTRPVVDDRCLPKERMIGQTGKTVSPELYLALGISGSPHHVAGIQGSGRILSVNRDQRAPIFGVADAGFIGDLKNILPGLIERIRRYRDGSDAGL